MEAVRRRDRALYQIHVATMTYVQSKRLMIRIHRSDWISQPGALIFSLCDAAMATALAERPPLKREAPVADLLAALTAFGLGDPPDELRDSGRRGGPGAGTPAV